MARYENAEIRKGGQTVRVDVTVDASIPLTTGTTEWGGTLYPPNNIGLVLDHAYSLVLPGFSPARIVITSEANPADSTVTFRGVGRAPTEKTTHPQGNR